MQMTNANIQSYLFKAVC